MSPLQQLLVFGAAVSTVLAAPAIPNTERACEPLPHGRGRIPQPDTAEAFQSFPAFSLAATSATTPVGYVQAYSNLVTTFNEPSQFIRYTDLDSYDVSKCAAECGKDDKCNIFGIFFERSPMFRPGPKCPNPPSSTMIKCTLWSGTISPKAGVNNGQTREKFRIVMAGSNAYVKDITFSNKKDGSSNILKNWVVEKYQNGAAIQVPLDCNGVDTYMGVAAWRDGKFDAQRCLDACKVAGDTDIQSRKCRFVNTYVQRRNGVQVSQHCAMFSEYWPAPFATNLGQRRGDVEISETDSYGLRRVEVKGTACYKPKDLPAPVSLQSSVVPVVSTPASISAGLSPSKPAAPPTIASSLKHAIPTSVGTSSISPKAPTPKISAPTSAVSIATAKVSGTPSVTPSTPLSTLAAPSKTQVASSRTPEILSKVSNNSSTALDTSSILPATSPVVPSTASIGPATTSVVSSAPSVVPVTSSILSATPSVLSAAPSVAPSSPIVPEPSSTALITSSQLPASPSVTPGTASVLPATPASALSTPTAAPAISSAASPVVPATPSSPLNTSSTALVTPSKPSASSSIFQIIPSVRSATPSSDHSSAPSSTPLPSLVSPLGFFGPLPVFPTNMPELEPTRRDLADSGILLSSTISTYVAARATTPTTTFNQVIYATPVSPSPSSLSPSLPHHASPSPPHPTSPAVDPVPVFSRLNLVRRYKNHRICWPGGDNCWWRLHPAAIITDPKLTQEEWDPEIDKKQWRNPS